MVGGRGLQIAVSLGANLALVRLLTPSDFGRFALVAACVSIVGSLVNARLEDVLLRLPEEDLKAGRLADFGAALTAEIVLLVGGSLAVLAALGLLNGLSFLLVIGSGAGSWMSAQSALYERKFDYRTLSVIETTAQATAQVLTVVGALSGLGPLVLYVRDILRVIVTGTGLGMIGELRRVGVHPIRRRDWKFVWRRIRGFWGDGLLEQAFDQLVLGATGLLVGDRITGYFYQARLLARAPQRLLAPFAFRIRMNQFAHHTERTVLNRAVLRSVAHAAIPLLASAGLAAWWAEPVIPWLLGEDWTDVVPLFLAMLGLVPGLTLLDTLKAYFMAKNWMGPFLRIGRGAQYLGAVAVTGIALWSGVPPARSLAFGLSAAYVLPVLMLMAFLIVLDRDQRETESAGAV